MDLLRMSQSHLVFIVASGVMLGLLVAGAFRAGAVLMQNHSTVGRIAGTLITLLSFLFGAWITVTTLMGY